MAASDYSTRNRQRFPIEIPRWARYISAIVLLFVAAVTAMIVLETRSLRTTKSLGNEIINAIESFRAATGRYPQSLGELTPRFIPRILDPAWGLQTWQYSSTRDTFSLRVNESEKTGDGNAHWLEYQDRERGWQLGD
jgi:hypothetical protein